MKTIFIRRWPAAIKKNVKGKRMKMQEDGFITLGNRQGECRISLWGGNLVSYRPKDQKEDVFWLGELNKFDNVQAIRGGVPVCWPRFAEEKLNKHLPRHGFARISRWHLSDVRVDENGAEATLLLVPAAEFKLKAEARLSIKMTDKLEYCLETVNPGNEVLTFSEALHAYFNVGSLDEVEISGLSGSYKNSLDGQIYKLEDNLKIKGEFDSIFTDHSGTVEIVDPVFKRVISVSKSGSDTIVVWNPGKDLAEMSPGQYKKFVCVEPSNTGASFVRLEPGEKHKIAMTVQVRSL